MTLVERIRRGEEAIAAAKSQGRDVRDWEAHLEMLKRQASECAEPAPSLTADPVVSVETWFPVFRELVDRVLAKNVFDYRWVREHRPDLYGKIKAVEARIDALNAARISEVMEVAHVWRELTLKAAADQQNFLVRSCEWYSPRDIVEAGRRVLGSIDLDPASNVFAQEIVRAKEYFTEANDGLTKSWRGKVWLNPPYDAPGKFVDKLIGAFNAGEVTEALVLLNNATDTVWFHRLLDRFPVCVFKGRLHYWNPTKTGKAPRQGQVIFYLGPNVEKFYAEFGPLGSIHTARVRP